MTSVTVPLVKEIADGCYCMNEAIKAILALRQHGGGPAHINMHTGYSLDFSVKELPIVRKIELHTAFDKLPELQEGKRVAIFIGAHKPFTVEETNAIDHFFAIILVAIVVGSRLISLSFSHRIIIVRLF